jgi:hypothetical protein
LDRGEDVVVLTNKQREGVDIAKHVGEVISLDHSSDSTLVLLNQGIEPLTLHSTRSDKGDSCVHVRRGGQHEQYWRYS